MSLRILALTPTFHPLVGGVETSLVRSFGCLADMGHEIVVVTPRHQGPARESLRPGLDVVRVGRSMRSRPAKFLRYQAWQWRAAARLHEESPFDVAHLTYGVHASLIQPLLRRRLGLPIVIDEHHLGTGAEISDASENPMLVRPLLRASYRHASAVIAQSRDTGAFIERASGRRDWKLVPLGTDAELFHPKRADPTLRARYGAPLLVTASRLSRRKNLGAMLDAMAMVHRERPEAVLVVAGDGPERETLERRARELGLSAVVAFTGFLPDADLARLLASADVFLSTSTYEAFGLSLIDAMASGAPVVAFDARGPSDFLRDGDAGRVTQHDAGELARATLGLLDDEAERAAMGRRGREIVEAQYTWERNAQLRAEVLESVVR